jgi:hypothetical protein
MLYLPCASCGQPRAVTEVRTWIADAAYCSDACAEAVRAAGRAPVVPDEATALAAAKTSLAKAIDTVKRVGRQVASMPQPMSGDAAAVLGLVTGGLLGGLVGSVLADEASTNAYDQTIHAMHAVDAAIEEVARRLMVLHALGFPIASAMTPLVMTHAPAGPSIRALASLLEELKRLAAGVDVWVADGS